MDEGEIFLLALIAIIFPPAAVAFLSGCGVDLCINVLLTILGWIPGCVHAFWLLLRRADANRKYGYQNWIYSSNGHYRPRQGQYQGPYYNQPPSQLPSRSNGNTKSPQPHEAAEPRQAGYTEPPPPFEPGRK